MLSCGAQEKFRHRKTKTTAVASARLQEQTPQTLRSVANPNNADYVKKREPFIRVSIGVE